MRAFSDLEQSKKLAEILPLESADMHYCLENRDVATEHEIGITPFIKAKRFEGKCNITDVQPAWSLAALLDVLQYPTLFQNGDEEWGCTVWIDTTKPYSISPKDNPVDACVEMVIKLHELNLL